MAGRSREQHTAGVRRGADGMRPRHRGTVAAVRSKQAETSCQAGKGTALVDINTFGNPVVSKPLDAPVPLESETSSVTEEPVGDVRILAEIRKWEERRDKLLGLDKVQVDITSGGKEFKGFSSVLPVVPGIDEIVRRIDEERERKLSEEDE